MQQKQQSIRIIPKARAKAPAWVNLLVSLVVGLVVIVFALFLVFYFLSASANTRSEQLKNEIDNLETADLKILKANTLVASNKISDFNKILDNHSYFSKVFLLLRKNAHIKAQFLDFQFDSQNFQLTISGVTQDFETLGQQLLILFFEKDISNLSMSSLELDENGHINFDLSFTINQEFFKP